MWSSTRAREGIGGLLEHSSSGTPLEFVADALNDQDAKRMKAKIGDAAGQASWETLAVLGALRIWAKFFRDRWVCLRVRSDSSAALSLAIKMASTSPIMNGLGAEIALTLELYGLEELFAEQWPGKLNVRADILSRVWAPGAPERYLHNSQRSNADLYQFETTPSSSPGILRWTSGTSRCECHNSPFLFGADSHSATRKTRIDHTGGK